MHLIEPHMIGERIKLRRKVLGLTQTEVAARCSVSKATVSDWEKGLFQPKDKESVANALKTNSLWLSTGKGASETLNVSNASYRNRPTPLISWVQAGSWSEIVDNYQPGDSDEVYPCPEKISGSGFALTVVGESMFPEYISGEIIYVDPEVEAVNGSYVVVRQNGDSEVTFKKLIIEGSEKMLKAVNPDWPNPIMKMLPDAVVCGVVIGSYRKRY